MPQIRYIDAAGTQHEIEVPVGYTLMEGAFNAQLAGMAAECGGACACGTCHSYIAPEWLARLPAVEDLEDAMLFMVEDRRENSRLACQIHVTEDMEGLELEIADNG